MEERTKVFLKNTIARLQRLMKNKLIAALYFLIQGVPFVIHPSTETDKLAKQTAILLIVLAAIGIVLFLCAKQKDVLGVLQTILCGVLIALGIFFLLHLDLLASVLRYALAGMTLIGGVSGAIQAFRMPERKKNPTFWFSLAAAVLMIGLSVGMVAAPAEIGEVQKRLLGIVMVVAGCLQVQTALHDARLLRMDGRSA